MNLDEICEPLGDLYSATGYDWHLEISYCLTEPTCPTAFITPEDWHIARYRVDADSIEESLTKVVALVKAEILDRKIIGHYAPYTNPDDDAFAKWLHARAAGSDEQMPDIPGRKLPRHYEWVLDGYLNSNTFSEEFWASNEREQVMHIMTRVNDWVGDSRRLDHGAAKKMIRSKLVGLRIKCGRNTVNNFVNLGGVDN